VGENVGLPLSLNGVDGAEQSERVRELLAAVGLPERAAAYPENLSGGEMQRVAIARAVSHRPALVLADEPTGNLDRETGQRVIQLLRWLVGEGGHTAVIVTHDVETVAICDRVLRLEDGRLRDTAP
jgi:putative ABC transport system ATP-binding protein